MTDDQPNRTQGPNGASPDRLRAHYELEKRWAGKLRAATRQERQVLFSAAYQEVARFVGQVAPSEEMVRVRHRWVANTVRYLSRFLNADTTFCEIGPGDCLVVLEVAKRVKRAYAVDIQCEQSQSVKGPSNYALLVSDGVSIPLPPQSVDVVFSNSVMEHIHPQDAVDQLANIGAALKPGGVYICVTPNRLSGPHDVSGAFDSEATGFHLKEYTAGELASLFKRAGFTKNLVLVGAKGRYVRMPLFIIRGLEWFLEVLPYSIRRPVARSLPIALLLGVRIVGRKPL
jgi:SAM-dependent methyltransferase